MVAGGNRCTVMERQARRQQSRCAGGPALNSLFLEGEKMDDTKAECSAGDVRMERRQEERQVEKFANGEDK